MSNNLERLQAEIAKDVREIVQFGIKDETIGFLTITDVVVSSDHSYCKIFVSFFNNPEKNLEKLNRKKGFVRSALAKRIKTRRVPEIEFVVDKSFLNFKKVDDALKKEEEEISSFKKDEENITNIDDLLK